MMNQPQAKLDEMPRLVKEKIVDALEWRDRQKLRESTASYVHIVDTAAIHIDRLFICLCRHSIDVFYQQTGQSANCTHTVYTPASPTYRHLQPAQFVEHVVADLALLLRNPKLTIDQLLVSFGMADYGVMGNLRHWRSRLYRYWYTRRSDSVRYHEFFKALTRTMSSLFGQEQKLKVKQHAVYVSNESLVPDNFAYFLKYLDPVVLESYQIEHVEGVEMEVKTQGALSEIHVQSMVQSSPWARLKSVQILDHEVNLRLSDVWHFSRFDGALTGVTENDVKGLIRFLNESPEEITFDIITPDLSTEAILTSIGRSVWRNHKHWRRYAMEKLDMNLIFKTIGNNRFTIYCERPDPEIDDFDEMNFL